MNDKFRKLVLFFGIPIIVLVAIGAVEIYFYFKLIEKPVSPSVAATISSYKKALENAKWSQTMLGMLKSNVVTNITLYGTVKNLYGSTIVITTNKQNVSFMVDPLKVSVFFLKDGKKTNAKFSDIKVGTNIIVDSRVSFYDQLVGSHIYIY